MPSVCLSQDLNRVISKPQVPPVEDADRPDYVRIGLLKSVSGQYLNRIGHCQRMLARLLVTQRFVDRAAIHGTVQIEDQMSTMPESL